MCEQSKLKEIVSINVRKLCHYISYYIEVWVELFESYC